ncbi:hypothetical protein ADICYQ_0759 [Cyclobacterium qasimii M12-11B]|uniref:Uncharacterized protein n=1 Tax=Cyclobacterium qasimii M12-11B TaxID=641524 RepID=S7VL67_9BACT|nr:hypothetical protein ADICYQ_0759 [Cyclobacterium qasimii M12-11B]
MKGLKKIYTKFHNLTSINGEFKSLMLISCESKIGKDLPIIEWD